MAKGDVLLETIVQTFIEIGVPFPLTLTVGGILVTGEVIGEGEYFDIVIERTGSLARELGAGEESIATITEFVWGLSHASADRKVQEEGASHPLEYIHLRNAFFVAGSGFIPQSEEGFLWRGKISEIDGFIMGKIRGYPNKN